MDSGVGQDNNDFGASLRKESEIREMVLIIMNKIQFEAEKFETRTMPTPNMKGKEMIYWIRVTTSDKRLATDLKRFLDSPPKYIDLRVPSTFISAQTELESFRPLSPKLTSKQEPMKRDDQITEAVGSSQEEDSFRFEIVLRRTLSEATTRSTQSPYG
jgi:hypothetical protein